MKWKKVGPLFGAVHQNLSQNQTPPLSPGPYGCQVLPFLAVHDTPPRKHCPKNYVNSSPPPSQKQSHRPGPWPKLVLDLLLQVVRGAGGVQSHGEGAGRRGVGGRQRHDVPWECGLQFSDAEALPPWRSALFVSCTPQLEGICKPWGTWQDSWTRRTPLIQNSCLIHQGGSNSPPPPEQVL